MLAVLTHAPNSYMYTVSPLKIQANFFVKTLSNVHRLEKFWHTDGQDDKIMRGALIFTTAN